MESCWPNVVAAGICSHLGAVIHIEPLGGMSGSAVVRIRGERGTAILKRSPRTIEMHVYTIAAAVLRAAGIDVPVLYLAHQEAGTCWLLLEDIPYPLSRERWLADDEVIGALRRLHAIDPRVILPTDHYVPIWTAAMTAQAVLMVPALASSEMQSHLDMIRSRCQTLFAPTHVICGDPNPANWGLREDGSLVLFDWERVTLGSPAIDLAITVPGLGNPADYAAVASSYQRDANTSTLTRDIADAKVWTVIEFLSGCARGEVVQSFPLESLTDAIPGWLRSLRADT
jgi:hypothetical protein